MLQITEVKESPLENKKYRAYTNDGKHYDFGSEGSKTYLDHHNQFLRDRYRERHFSNEKEYYLIDNAIMSPALLTLSGRRYIALIRAFMRFQAS